MKLLGWIRGAVEFIKLPARPRKDEPLPDAPRDNDPPTVAPDRDPATIEALAESRPSREPESPFTAEPEGRIEAESESRTDIESESPAIVEPESETSVDSESRTDVEPQGAQDAQDIDRRRAIVREFFNDYWSSIDDKPASFAERLDGAEGYINERVAARGEIWRLDPATRKQLGLPRSRKG